MNHLGAVMNQIGPCCIAAPYLWATPVEAASLQQYSAMFKPWTERASMDSSEVEANLGADPGVVSAHARYIVFTSRSTNLVGNDTNGTFATFLTRH